MGKCYSTIDGGCVDGIDCECEDLPVDNLNGRFEKQPMISPIMGLEQDPFVEDLPLVDPTEFPDATITVEMKKMEGAQRLGIRTHCCTGSACIAFIYPGSMFDRYNKANPVDAIQVGDHLVEVNGISNDVIAMKKEWTSNPNLFMKFIAAKLISVEIEKAPGGKLGVKTRAGTKVHKILSIIAGGVLDAWNRNNRQLMFGGGVAEEDARAQVRGGDYIVEVNGTVGDAEYTRQEWISSGKVDLVVLSPRPRGLTNEEQSEKPMTLCKIRNDILQSQKWEATTFASNDISLSEDEVQDG